MEPDRTPAAQPAGPADEPQFVALTDRHRHELNVHCYRMLGSFDDAEDLVQETFLRAWRRRDDLERLENVRAWLYRIATNACLDMIKAKGRRVRELESFRDIPWLEPFPDVLMGPADDPHAAAVERETIELTFLAVLQLLPPRQRAALVLRDVLAWPVAEVGALLDLSTASVNSALQRARATLREHHPIGQRDAWTVPTRTADEQAVLGRYIRAYEDGDTAATLALLAEDVRVTMPPAPFLFEGRDAIMELAARARSTGTWRLVPTSANRQPAAACYLQDPDTGQFRAFKIDVLRVAGTNVAEITTFGHKHFAAFGLPEVLA
jgi:RNA polymerase sigma-70 factor (ECF subfamily)